MNPPSIPGLGTTGGFSMYIINKAGDSPQVMAERANEFLAEARKSPAIESIYTTFDTSTPSLQFDVNREKAAQDGVLISLLHCKVSMAVFKSMTSQHMVKTIK